MIVVHYLKSGQRVESINQKKVTIPVKLITREEGKNGKTLSAEKPRRMAG